MESHQIIEILTDAIELQDWDLVKECVEKIEESTQDDRDGTLDEYFQQDEH